MDRGRTFFFPALGEGPEAEELWESLKPRLLSSQAFGGCGLTARSTRSSVSASVCVCVCA